MFISEACPEWFWLIPLLGMVLMFGLMFFICAKGGRNGVSGGCGCGRTNKQYNQEAIEDGKKQTPGTSRA